MAEPPESPDPRRAVGREATPRPGRAWALLTGLTLGAVVMGLGLFILDLAGPRGTLRTALVLAVAALAVFGAVFLWRVATAAVELTRHSEVDGTSLRPDEDEGRDPWAP